MGTAADPLAALADPTRRRIVELLSQGPRSAGELADGFDISRPAVSRHLRVLREAELVSSEAEAQRRVYRLEPHRFDELATWLDGIRGFWANRLDALETELRRGQHHRAGT
jgi:DNA-binding transcriptional ArsR family regulator